MLAAQVLARAKNAITRRGGAATPAIEGVQLAAPWRRWLASATDALMLLVAHLLLVAPLTYFASDPFDALALTIRISPFACWAYLWWGWSRGQTPGQRVWKVRIIADDGEPMTARRALKRLGGYALVCLTLKIGLLPILFDPLRRGWHDRIAQTLVVEADAPVPDNLTLRAAFAAVRQREETANREHSTLVVPDFALSRRGWPLIFAAYLALSVALTWPVAQQWRSTLAGDGGDAWVFVWNNWFFSYALQTGGPILSTDLLFHGFQTPLLFHTMNWFDCVLAWPLLQFFSPVETYNLLFLLTPALCAMASYWLACSLSRARLASFLVAPVFGFSPYFMMHGLGHANLTAAQMLPIFAGLFYAALVRERARYALGAGIALALAALCDWQYLLFGSVAAVALWSGVEWAHARAGETFQLRRAGLAIGALLCALCLLAPLLLPLLRESHDATYMNKARQAGAFGANINDWTRVGKLNSIFRVARTLEASNENDLTPGWCVLTLCALGLVAWGAVRRRQLLPWLCLSAIAGVLASGPLLFVNFNALLFAIGMGAPGNGLSPPWNTSPMVTQANLLALNSTATPSFTIEMPFSWLAPHLPMLNAFRVPARLGVLVLMCCAPLAALGLNWLLSTVGAQRRALQALLVISVVASMACEYAAWPYPTSDSKVPAFYRQIARDPRHYAIVDVPISTNSRFMGWQTVHGKSTIVGVTARCPPAAFALVARNALLRALSANVFQSSGYDSDKRPPVNFDYRPALRELQRLNVRYIVIHKHLVTAQRDAEIEAILRHLQLPQTFDDADTRVYQIEP